MKRVILFNKMSNTIPLVLSNIIQNEFCTEGVYELLPIQSVLGVVLFKTPSNVPAQASRFVKKFFRLNIFLTVAGIEECSYCDVG